jgi:hypothetical protein
MYNAAESSKLTTETFEGRKMVKICVEASDGGGGGGGFNYLVTKYVHASAINKTTQGRGLYA